MVPSAAEVVNPFAERQAANIQQHEEDDDADRNRAGEEVTVLQFLNIRAADVKADADAGEDDGRKIEDIRKPVTPAGEEAVFFAEAALGPEIDAAFARPLLREFGNGCALRPEEATEGDDPKPDSKRAARRDGRHHVEVSDCDDKKQHEVFSAQNPFQAGLMAAECDRLSQLTSGGLTRNGCSVDGLLILNIKPRAGWLCGVFLEALRYRAAVSGGGAELFHVVCIDLQRLHWRDGERLLFYEDMLDISVFSGLGKDRLVVDAAFA